MVRSSLAVAKFVQVRSSVEISAADADTGLPNENHFLHDTTHILRSSSLIKQAPCYRASALNPLDLERAGKPANPHRK